MKKANQKPSATPPAADAVRETFVASATESYASLHRVINKLSRAELYQALALEANTRRRDSLIRRIIGRLARVEGQRIKQNLLKEYLPDA